MYVPSTFFIWIDAPAWRDGQAELTRVAGYIHTEMVLPTAK